MLESLARACAEHAPRTVFMVEVERSRIAAAEARTVAAQLLMQVRSPVHDESMHAPTALPHALLSTLGVTATQLQPHASAAGWRLPV